MKLIINTPSSEKITPGKKMAKGDYVFAADYLSRPSPGMETGGQYNPGIEMTWESRVVHNPDEGDMATQAQKFLSDTGDWHPYLEGYDIDSEKRTIHMGFGS